MPKVCLTIQQPDKLSESLFTLLEKREFLTNTIRFNSMKNIFEINCIRKRVFKKNPFKKALLFQKKFLYIIESLIRIKNVIYYEFESSEKINLYSNSKLSFDENTGIITLRASRNLNIRIKVQRLNIELSEPDFIRIDANLTRLIDPLRLSPSCGHYNLTRPAMKKTGFSKSDILTAYAANVSVDKFANRINKPLHYMPGTKLFAEKFISDALDKAISHELKGEHQQAIKALGEGMHTLQDRYAHHDQNAGWKDHLSITKDPDNPRKHQEEFLNAYRATKLYLEKFVTGVKAGKDQTKQLYDEINFLITMKDTFCITE